MKLTRLLAVALPIAAVALSSRSSFGDTSSSSGSGGSGGGGGGIPGLRCNSAGALTITTLDSTSGRMSTDFPDAVSFDDCTQNKTLTFTYVYEGSTPTTIEAYAFIPGNGVDDCLLAASHGTPACIKLRAIGEQKSGNLVVSDNSARVDR